MTRFIPIYLISFLYACGGSHEEDLSGKDLVTAPDTSAKTQQMLPELKENEDVLRMIDDCFTNDCPLDSILVDTVCPKHYFHNPVAGVFFQRPEYRILGCNFELLFYKDTLSSIPLMRILAGAGWKHAVAGLGHDKVFNSFYLPYKTYYFRFENRIIRYDLTFESDSLKIKCLFERLEEKYPKVIMTSITRSGFLHQQGKHRTVTSFQR